MNPEIDRLIKIAIADGEISEKERAIILRKAEALGLDKEEVDMILEGELALIKKDLNSNSQLKSHKEGVVKKCPSCGAPVLSFTTRCTDCGHEFIGTEATHSIIKLFELLKKCEIDERAKPLPTNLFTRILTANSAQIAVSIAHAQSNIINSFPVPVTKTDILEFLSQAISKCKKSSTIGFNVTDATLANNVLADAWRNKCEEIVVKARFSLKDDKRTLEEIETYARQIKIK